MTEEDYLEEMRLNRLVKKYVRELISQIEDNDKLVKIARKKSDVIIDLIFKLQKEQYMGLSDQDVLDNFHDYFYWLTRYSEPNYDII